MCKDGNGKLVQTGLGIFLMLISGLAMSQVMTVDTVTGSTSGTSVDVPWLLEVDGLQGANFEIRYDNAVFTPDLTNCLDASTAPFQTCAVEEIAGEDVIIVSSLDFLNPLAADQGGTITFEYAPGVSAGTYPLPVTEVVVNTVPPGTDITINSGAIILEDFAPALSITAPDPAAIDFGNVREGSSSSEVPVTVTNSGNADGLVIEDVSFGGADPANFTTTDNGSCGALPSAPLNEGASCTVHLVFGPDAERGFSATATISSNNGSADVALSGTGTGSDANLTIAPTSADFGTLDINDPAVTRDFTLQNAGSNDSLDITSTSVQPVMLRGTMVTPFDIVADTCEGQTLAPQADCLITVAFDPSEAGTFDSTLAVSSSANNVNADLTGVGTATADIVVDPPFGPVSLGFGEAGENVTRNGTVTNNGSASADVSCTLDDTTGVFSTTPSPLSATVDAGSTVDFSLSCALPDTGEEGDTYSATLTCSVDNDVVGTHDLSCGVTEFEPLPVPTMSNWSIALFALLMLLVGGISIRFFRV